MASQHIVVDGSNIATEGRSQPSLAQLEEAVAELRREYPDSEVTVIVDATFSHRIDPSELERFERAALEGDYVHPPAGAVGRGDAFLLRVAEKVDGTALSNDSFQEFHGEHPWLFERGRLMGATPVPGVGWIFSPRTPVRGSQSKRAVRDEERAKKKISKAIAAATKEAVSPPRPQPAKWGEHAKGPEGSRGERHRAPCAPAAVNDPLSFISFIADHPLGTEVDGQVDSYTSHGAVVMAAGTQCYVPLANLAVPAPRSAREMLKRGEHRRFVVTALDPQRRGVELALPGVAVVSGRPSEDMIAAELRLAKKSARATTTAPVKKAKKTLMASAEKESPGRVGAASVLAPTDAPAAEVAPAPARARAKKPAPPPLPPPAPAPARAPAKKPARAPAPAPARAPAPAQAPAPAPARAPAKKPAPARAKGTGSPAPGMESSAPNEGAGAGVAPTLRVPAATFGTSAGSGRRRRTHRGGR